MVDVEPGEIAISTVEYARLIDLATAVSGVVAHAPSVANMTDAAYRYWRRLLDADKAWQQYLCAQASPGQCEDK